MSYTLLLGRKQSSVGKEVRALDNRGQCILNTIYLLF